MDSNQNQQKPAPFDSFDQKQDKVSSKQINSNFSIGEIVNPEITQIYEFQNSQSTDHESGQPQDTHFDQQEVQKINHFVKKNMIPSLKKPTEMLNEEIKFNESSKPLLPLSAKEEVLFNNKKAQISRGVDPKVVYEKTLFEINKKPGNESVTKALREWFMKEYQVKPGPDPIPSRPESVRPKNNAELMNEAFLELEKAKIQLSKITYSDFMKISKSQVIFDEYGKHVADLKNADGTKVQEFFQTESGERIKPENFFNILSHQVFRNLKYLGNFNDTVESQFFLSRDAKNEYFRNISSKVLFYFIFYACEQIQDQLMARYQEEPFNPVSLVTYQQWQKDKGVLNVKNESLRTINLSFVFKKMKIMKPTLICVGKRLINKSTLLNDLFRVQFETLAKESIGLFHDSVDIIFSSQEFPTGFNVIDFNGQSNEDHQMIELLLKTLPKAVLFVQNNSDDYIENVLERMDEEVREKFSQQLIYIDKSAQPDEEVFYKIQDSFPNLKLDLDKENATFAQQQVFYMGNDSSGDQYKSRIQSLREKLSEFFKSQYLQDIFKLKSNDSIKDQGVWDGYWSLEDSFRSNIKTCYKMKLQEKNSSFKKKHMELKNYLSEHKTIKDQQKLSRKLVFPRYNREIIRKQLKKQLDDSDQRLTQKQKIELENQILSLDNQNVAEHELFVKFIKYYMMENHELVSDMLSLIESYYMPLIKVKKAELKQAIVDANKIRDDLQKFYTEDQRKKTNLTQQEEQKFQNLSLKKSDFEKKIKSLMDEVEDKVLDSDLFLREAKLKFKPTGNKNNQKEEQTEREKFLKIHLKEFQNGKPIEIIDGDLDKCENHSLEQIMQWLTQMQSGSNKSIFVVTVLGPQSSGKSTLLNYLFGAKFAVSAGRCTKGLNAMLLTTDYPDLPNIIILDSEGIFSIERDDPKFDRRLAIFCMSISNLLMINIKGEVNQNVAKVLQVAVYAMKKITECDQATNIPDIKFILRDQVDGNPEFVENTYQQLKIKFKEAANAAGCSLEKIINLDYDFQNMVQLFSMAFSQLTYGKEKITQSTEVFRKKCAEFRYQLFQQQSLKAGGAQNQSFSRWQNSVSQVWQAVLNNENLMVLQDLKSIIDYRFMITMMEEYSSIMSQLYIKTEEKKLYLNPLYVSTQDQRANNPFNIEGDQTFYAKCQLVIENGIFACNRADINEKQLQILVEKFNKDLEKLKDEEIKIGRERVQIATQQMDQEIISQAKRYLDNSIDAIYSKANTSWKEKQASGNIDFRIRQTENQLKNKLLDSIILDKKLTLKDFQKIVIKEIDKLEKEVKKNFLADEEEMNDQAKTAFKIQYQQSSKEQDNSSQSEESKQVSQKNTRYQILRDKIEPSKNMIFLLTKLPDLKFEKIEEFYAKIDKASLENKAKNQAKLDIEKELS